MRHLLLAGGTLFAIPLGLAMAQQQASQAQPQQASATIINTKGERIGSARLTQTPNGVLIQMDARGLQAGERASHIHEVGRCNAGDEFESAGGHFNPDGKQHGFQVAAGPHAGDMANLVVGQDGSLKAEVHNPKVSLGAGPASLFDADGSALVLHAKPDDHRSQPSGDAGGRIACGVIERRG